MGTPSERIKDSLIQFLEAIKTSNREVVVRELGNLDDLLAAHREELHPQLVHFLEGRSYAKAWLFLGGELDIPVGACGGRGGRHAGRKEI